MKLTLLSKQEYTSITLPEKRAGRYWVRGRAADGRMADIVSVEAVCSQEEGEVLRWVMKSNRRFKILNQDGGIIQAVTLALFELYRLQSADGIVQFTLFAEPLSSDRKQYKGYVLRGQAAKLTIGREGLSHICYANEYVSGSHAELVMSADETIIQDQGSTNGTYVNGRSVQRKRLNSGDVIYIMGLQIIVIGKRIFLNNPDGRVEVQSQELMEYHAPPFRNLTIVDEEADEFEEISTEYYYRAPRFKQDAEEFELKVDAPPAYQDNEELPLVMMIGPSLTMGMASAASGAYMVISAVSRGDPGSAVPSGIMCVSMLLGTLMWPLIMKLWNKKFHKDKESRRQRTYKEYLSRLDGEITREAVRQEEILRNNDVNLSVRMDRILAAAPQMWERTPKHSDFLSLRLGYGNLPMKVSIRYPERRFAAEQDNLTERMYQFGEAKRWLHNVPICLAVAERFVSGVYADKNILFPYARSLILQIAALYSYDEVKIVLIYDANAAPDLDFARWLPHTMDNERKVRYLAANVEEAKELSAGLDSLIEYRKELGESRLKDEMPYFVVLCLDKELAAKTECVRRVLGHKENIGFSVLAMYERLVDLPKECMAVVELQENGGGNLTLIGEVSDPPIPFGVDIPRQIDMERIVDVLANTFVDMEGAGFALPRKYTFFEMLDIGMVEHLNLLDNWASNDPTKSLAATVGVDKYGEAFRLDLHERAHGPHGLVAGMTGSGKSEFLIAYILSMAVTYHPYEVAFILIDYKGGGMAKSFENIPHTAGIITNLDGNGMKRSLVSMRSELHRRERIFRDTSQRYSVSNIDIYKYQRLYRDGKVSEPLPHLFIISDEFAELKKEQPDFMTELTSTARVGRSLGVHLILATQKPGGVVDDQIRSNSRFRICLKVQDSGDSMEMLGRPEAASLVDTGRFYLQVGYNELFEIGQSAWAGAPYYPSAKVIRDHDDAVSVINTNGRVIAEANTDPFAMVKDPPKQLDVITEHIRRVCEEEQISRWKMWLDPIPELIYVDDLAEKYGRLSESGKLSKDGRPYSDGFVLNPIVGELDDPVHQSQGVLRIPITTEGNVIVYGSAGSGKSMFVEAMCYSLMCEHTPQQVNIYMMDFGAETMTAFAAGPHVGDVILSYETEKVNNLFKLMLGKLETRKKLLSGFGGSMIQYNQQADRPEPNLVVMIHNFAAFAELFENKMNEVSYLTREGTKYGIYFILTCTGVNNVRFSLLQNFKLLYCLQMNKADDYSAVVGKTEGALPEKFKGRGLVRIDAETLLEFQVAHITREEPPYGFIRAFAKEKSDQYSGKGAVSVPVLPEKVSEEYLFSHIRYGDLTRIPIGVEKAALEISYYDFTASVVSLVLSLNQEWQEFSSALGRFIASRCGIKTYFFAPAGKISSRPETERLHIFSDSDGCVRAVREVYGLVLSRNNEYKDRLSDGGTLPQFEPVLVMIQSMSLLKAMLNRYQVEEAEKEASDDTPLNRLQLAMEKCCREYNIYFIVAESLNLLTPFTVENWYKTHINGSNGIWIGSGIGTQYRLNVSKKPGDYTSELGSDFGFAVHNATAVLVKLLQ